MKQTEGKHYMSLGLTWHEELAISWSTLRTIDFVTAHGQGLGTELSVGAGDAWMATFSHVLPGTGGLWWVWCQDRVLWVRVSVEELACLSSRWALVTWGWRFALCSLQLSSSWFTRPCSRTCCQGQGLLMWSCSQHGSVASSFEMRVRELEVKEWLAEWRKSSLGNVGWTRCKPWPCSLLCDLEQVTSLLWAWVSSFLD